MKRDAVLSARVAEADKRRLRLAAVAAGITTGELVSAAIASEIERLAAGDPAVARVLAAAA